MNNCVYKLKVYMYFYILKYKSIYFIYYIYNINE